MSKTYEWLLVMFSIFTSLQWFIVLFRDIHPFVSQYKLLFWISLCPNLNCGVFKAINKPWNYIRYPKYSHPQLFCPPGRVALVRTTETTVWIDTGTVLSCYQDHMRSILHSALSVLLLLGNVVDRLTEMMLIDSGLLTRCAHAWNRFTSIVVSQFAIYTRLGINGSWVGKQRALLVH